MEVTGILKLKKDTQQISDKFKKREFVLTTEASTPYPQHVLFQLTQDKCDVLNGFSEGDTLRVQFNLRGREWNGANGVQYFNTLEAWRIEKIQVEEEMNYIENKGSAYGSIDDNQDLPF